MSSVPRALYRTDTLVTVHSSSDSKTIVTYDNAVFDISSPPYSRARTRSTAAREKGVNHGATHVGGLSRAAASTDTLHRRKVVESNWDDYMSAVSLSQHRPERNAVLTPPIRSIELVVYKERFANTVHSHVLASVIPFLDNKSALAKARLSASRSRVACQDCWGS